MRVLALLVLGGCSFFATEGPRPPPGPTRCNRDMKAPVTDAIASVGAAFAAGVASVQNADRDAMIILGVAGAFGASSAYGLIQVRRCRAEYAKRPGWSLEAMPAVM
jgi:hypothetical protein